MCFSLTFPRRRAADKRLPSPLSSNRENREKSDNQANLIVLTGVTVKILLMSCFRRQGSRGTGPRATGLERVFLLPVRDQAIPNYRRAALAGVRFSRRSRARGGQAPALRAWKGFFSCAVRDLAIPNYRYAACSSLANLANLANPAHFLYNLANPAHFWLIKKTCN